MGVHLSVETSVTERSPPRLKAWETTQEPRLLVIGAYRMGFEIKPQSRGSLLRVFIDYDLPTSGAWRLVGRALGDWYARWCTAQMVNDARAHYGGAGESAGSRGLKP